MSLGLYLHIPYCFSKCRYCDFYSHPGERGVPDAYVDALLRELHRFAPDAPLRPDTVYFGGGTPSLLTPAQAKRLIRAADPVPGAEITLEANPETVTEESLQGFRAAGVNRISFGVQSARDSQLRTLGRPHSAKQARAAFAAARHAGFENISGDIMLALPHYTQAEFDETLELIEKGGATHISAYLLKIEPDSAFGKHPPEGLPTGDEAADFYLYAVEQLEHHGYRQYEISNFAKPGYEGRHNLIYWDCGDYLGLGPAAHSCMGGKRFCYAPEKKYRKNKAPQSGLPPIWGLLPSPLTRFVRKTSRELTKYTIFTHLPSSHHLRTKFISIIKLLLMKKIHTSKIDKSCTINTPTRTSLINSIKIFS